MTNVIQAMGTVALGFLGWILLTLAITLVATTVMVVVDFIMDTERD